MTLDGTVTKVVDGTAMCTDGKKIYTVNAPYGAGAITYPIYDIATGETTTWEPADIFSPAVIAADPVTGNIFIVSYQKLATSSLFLTRKILIQATLAMRCLRTPTSTTHRVSS